MPSALATAFQVCQQITQFHAKSFYFAGQKLPPQLAQDVYAVYAFCRISDDIVDESQADTTVITRDLHSWKELFEYVIAANQPVLPRALPDTDITQWYAQPEIRMYIVVAYADVIQRRGLNTQYPLDLIHGVGLDIHRNSYTDFAQLEEYCHFVAGVPGLMMADVFGITDQQILQYADTLGKAMQITNIMRDIGEDADRGRIYLPQQDLDTFGVAHSSVQNKQMTKELQHLMKHYISIAHAWYTDGRKGIPTLPPDIQVAIRSAARIYEKILNEIERNNYDVFSTRIGTSKTSKMRSFARIWLLNRFL